MDLAEVHDPLHLDIGRFSIITIALRRQRISRTYAPSCRFPVQPTQSKRYRDRQDVRSPKQHA